MNRKMRTRNTDSSHSRSTAIVVCICCFVVVLAATAHLVHSVQPAHQHGKAIADIVCSVCAYCVGPARAHGYVAPRFAIVGLSRFESASPALYASELLRIQIGRAPPVSIELSTHQS